MELVREMLQTAAERADVIKARVEHEEEAELDGLFELSAGCYVVFECDNPDFAHSIVADMSEDNVEVYESQFSAGGYIITAKK